MNAIVVVQDPHALAAFEISWVLDGQADLIAPGVCSLHPSTTQREPVDEALTFVRALQHANEDTLDERSCSALLLGILMAIESGSPDVVQRAFDELAAPDLVSRLLNLGGRHWRDPRIARAVTPLVARGEFNGHQLAEPLRILHAARAWGAGTRTLRWSDVVTSGRNVVIEATGTSEDVLNTYGLLHAFDPTSTRLVVEDVVHERVRSFLPSHVACVNDAAGLVQQASGAAFRPA